MTFPLYNNFVWSSSKKLIMYIIADERIKTIKKNMQFLIFVYCLYENYAYTPDTHT